MSRTDYQAGIRHAAQVLRSMAAEAEREEPTNKARPLCLTDAAGKIEAEARRCPDPAQGALL